MKLLILARGIPSKNDPQEGCFEWDQAKALAAKGHEVIVMAVDGRIRKFWRPLGITKTEKDGVIGYKLFYFPTAIIRRLINRKWGYAIEAWFAKKLFKRITRYHGKVDLLHSHYLSCSYLATRIKSEFSVPTVGTEHWSEVNKENINSEVRFLGTHTYKYLDQLIAVSKDLGASIRSHFGVESTVIHNLIDITNLTIPPGGADPHKPYTIIAVGSLIPRKGFDVLISAFSKSILKDKNVILRIIGGGTELDNLNCLIVSKGLSEKICLCGQMSKSEVFRELQNSDLYVLSSRLENFSVAIIEATANGLPAVATLCGGVEEYPVKEVIKIPVDEVDAMVEALEQSYERRFEIKREEIQNQTLKYFSPEAITTQLEEVYNKILKK
ncbi:MAG: glycosyltransferase [Muribaculaceae bacterium]|nr:glycosyltransferase [Muribaculaceae bacterium]